jgi:hypothetical protein
MQLFRVHNLANERFLWGYDVETSIAEFYQAWEPLAWQDEAFHKMKVFPLFFRLYAWRTPTSCFLGANSLFQLYYKRFWKRQRVSQDNLECARAVSHVHLRSLVWFMKNKQLKHIWEAFNVFLAHSQASATIFQVPLIWEIWEGKDVRFPAQRGQRDQ